MTMEQTQAAPKAYCNVLARQKGLDPAGHAGHFEDLMVMEVPLPWKKGVYERGGGQPDTVIELMELWYERYKAGEPYHHRSLMIAPDPAYTQTGRRRVMYYRRHTDYPAGFEKVEYVVPDDEAGRLAWALFEAREDLTAFERYRVPEMDTVRDVLVCTHGTVDAACAKFGYPLYNRLRRDYADEGLRVWRVSHFGGHVFAPTLVDLPTGHFWAYVEEAQVRPIVRREGSVEAMRGHYRGWVGLENPFLQAAEREMWQREGWVWFEWVKTGRVVEADSGDRPMWAVVEVDYRSTDGKRAGCYRGRVTVEREVETIGTTGYEAVYPYAQYVVREMDHMVTTEPDMA